VVVNDAVYKPTYSTSWALVIGVNDYQTAPPLNYAKSDAEAFAEMLQTKFGFFQENVTVLLDSAAMLDERFVPINTLLFRNEVVPECSLSKTIVSE
jgi:uncharacterized caspase-like protein